MVIILLKDFRFWKIRRRSSPYIPPGLNRILFPGPVKFSIAQKVFISGTVHIRVINYI
jgi:hypothetical protein